VKSVANHPHKRKTSGRRRRLDELLVAPLDLGPDPIERPWIAHPAYVAPPAALTSWESDDAPRSPAPPRQAALGDGTRLDRSARPGRASAPASAAGASDRPAQPAAAATRGARRPRLDTPTSSCKGESTTLAGDVIAEQEFRDAVAAIIGVRWKQRAWELGACGRTGVKLGCKGCGEFSAVPFRCRCRTCPHAQRAAAAKITDRLLQRIRVHDVLMEQQPWDGLGRKRARSWRLLTLTLPISRIPEANWDPIKMRAGIKKGRAAWTKFWRSTSWGRQRVTEKGQRSRRDTSAIIAGEFGPKNAMPHFHVMVYGEFIDKAELARLWAAALDLPLALVDVRKIEDPAEGIKEVVKYVAKGVGDEPLTPRHAAYIELALRNVHRVSIVGYLRQVKVTEEDGATEELRAEDVHDRETLCCEACGVIGEWSWEGFIDSRIIKHNGGFGLFRLTFRDLYPDWCDPADWIREGLPPGYVSVPDLPDDRGGAPHRVLDGEGEAGVGVGGGAWS